MKKFKLPLVLLLFVAAFIGILASCGGGGPHAIPEIYIVSKAELESAKSDTFVKKYNGFDATISPGEYREMLTVGETYYALYAVNNREKSDFGGIKFKIDGDYTLGQTRCGTLDKKVGISVNNDNEGYTWTLNPADKKVGGAWVAVEFTPTEVGAIKFNSEARYSNSGEDKELTVRVVEKRQIGVYSTVRFADESAYVNGVLNTDAVRDSVDMKLGKTYYAVVETDLTLNRAGDDIGEAMINIDISPSGTVYSTIDSANAGTFSETDLLETKSIVSTVKLPDSGKKVYKFIIALTPLNEGTATINVSVSGENTYFGGSTDKSTSITVSGTEATASTLEYTASPDGTYYIVTGLGTAQGSIITVPSTYNGLPVKEIGAQAFMGYRALRKLTLSEGIERIGASALEGCDKLFDITLPSTLTEVDATAFTGVYPQSASVPLSAIPFLPKEKLSGIFIQGGGTIAADTLLGFNRLRTLTALDGSLTAEENALSGLNIMTANIHADFIKHLPKDYVMFVNVNAGEAIAENEFENFTSLLQTTIYSGIKTIGNNAFIGCEKLHVIINKSLAEIKGVGFDRVNPNIVNLTRRGEFVYLNDASGKSIIAYVGENESVTLPNEAVGVYNYAFSNNKTVKSVFIPYKITGLGYYVFKGCDRLETVTFDEKSQISEIEYTFQNCFGLKNLHIPRNVTVVNGLLLSGSPNVETITVSANNSIYRSEGNCVIKKETGAVVLGCKGSVIPTSAEVTEIAEEAFRDNTSITSVYIPANIKKLYGTTFRSCTNIISITVDPSSPYYKAVNNCLIEKETGTLVLGCKTSVIPADTGITKIGEYAFYGCDITAVEIPSGVSIIGIAAFSGCKELTSVALPDGLTEIHGSAFAYMPKLTEIRIPKSVTVVGENAFECTKEAMDSGSFPTIYVQSGANKGRWHEYWHRKTSGYNSQNVFTIFYYSVKSY